MDRGNPKREILNAALKLFSVQGFEATSIAQVAGAILSSHFRVAGSLRPGAGTGGGGYGVGG